MVEGAPVPAVHPSGRSNFRHRASHWFWTAVLGTNTTVRWPSRRAASNPTRVLPAPGGSTTHARRSPDAQRASNASSACRWYDRNPPGQRADATLLIMVCAVWCPRPSSQGENAASSLLVRERGEQRHGAVKYRAGMGCHTDWWNTWARIQACMATAAAAPALMDRVEPNWAMESTETQTLRTSSDRPGPSWPKTRMHSRGRG